MNSAYGPAIQRIIMLIDSHCHLDFPDFASQLDDVVGRARAAGVGLMLSVSTHVRRSGQLTALAERYPDVYCSVGTHPHHAAEEADVTLEEIVEWTRHPKVAALGESGLDYHYDKSPRAEQQRGFRLHIAAARETGLPLIIHTREAEADTIAILEEELARGPFSALLHCFTSSAELARRAVELGLYISFSGVLTFKKLDSLRAIAAEVPEDRLLVETDAPFLAPEPLRGKVNEPAFVRHTARVLAKAKGVSEAEIARTTTENFHRLFRRIPRRQLQEAGAAA
jgi:TatD DNase family protein